MVLFPAVFGPSGYLSQFFLNPQNVLYSLAFLVPLILLYLIKPKPINVAVPSLMFILADMGKSNVRRFFRSIFRDVLFIIQALAIIMLSLAIAQPFINVDQESLVQQSIMVIDTSASVKAFDGDRFEAIKAAAREELADENIIILARQNPQVLDDAGEQRYSAGDAADAIDDLEATDMDGDLPGALDFAAQYAGPGTKVTIISDFVLSRLENPDLVKARIKVLRSKGAIVKMRSVGGDGDNVGIIGATINSQNGTITVKIQNFNTDPADIGLEYNDNTIQLEKNVLEGAGRPGSLLSVSIPVVNGITELKLTPEDDFETDNHYYISTPESSSVNVLMISNDNAVRNARVIPALLAASDKVTSINIEYATPPKIPELQHQIYIIKDLSTSLLLPGVVDDIHERVKEGAILIVFNQPGIFDTGVKDLLPVTLKPEASAIPGRIEVLANTSTGLMRGLSDPGQIDGDQLVRVQRTDDAVVHAYVITNDGAEPVIAHRRVGKGFIMYYGIANRQTMDLDPQSYAVIWGRIIDYVVPDLRLLNIGTGTIVTSATKNVNTPDGKRPSPTLATTAGIYQTGTASITANLYPLQMGRSSITEDDDVQYESLISRSADLEEESDNAALSGTEKTEVPWDLGVYLIYIGIGIMLFELLFVKLRGDL